MSSSPPQTTVSVTWWDRCSVLFDLFFIIKGATAPTLRSLFSTPSLLWKPSALRTLFFENVWKYMGDGVDEAGRETKVTLLPRATGVVLELGAGHGHNCKYLPLPAVTKYIALEPNPLMDTGIVTSATKAGFDASQIQVICCGAQETEKIVEYLQGVQVDTIISTLTLCGIPDVKNTLDRLCTQVLKPGGSFLYYEHVRCDPSPTIAWWQSFWTPIWEPILGCRLDKPSHVYVEQLDLWERREVWGKKDELPNLFWHRVGHYVKRS